MMRSAILAFRKSQSGAAMVELAFILLPLTVLLIGTLETVLVSIARASLDANLQAQAYDAANADQSQLQFFLARDALCARPGLYLVDCQSSSEFCFSIVPIDTIPSGQLASLQCQSNAIHGPALQGTLAFVTEYKVPSYLDIFGVLADFGLGTNRATTIRSVALAFRG
jgi:Flp pilus assembly pilin Flp